MVPTLIHDIGNWIDQFSDSLNRWESLLCELREAYLQGDAELIQDLCRRGEAMHAILLEGKQTRSQLLETASEIGYRASTLRELSQQMDGAWPALWTHRIQSMEHQLNRIQQLSVSLWITAFQARDFVSEMIRTLATGRSQTATYSPEESHSHEGGYLVNEAA